jgi:hypothetical protein
MHSYNNVNKFLIKQNASEEAMIKRMEDEERRLANPNGQQDEEEKKDVSVVKEKKWKQKFIKIWQYNDQLEGMGRSSAMDDE